MDLQAVIHHINAANAANTGGNPEKALAHCRRVLKHYPELVEAWYNQGIAHRSLKQRQQALDCQRKAAELGGQAPDALNAIGLEFIELDSYDEAERCLNRALALAPGHVYALSNKATLLQRQKNYGEAEACLRRAIALHPTFAPLQVNLGAILNKRTQFHAAEIALRRALELDPAIAEAWNNLANSLSGQRKFGEAAAACRQAIARDGRLLDAYSNLGDILRETRRFAEAAEAYGELFARAPEFPFVKGRLLYADMQCCDWLRFDELRTAVDHDLRKGRQSADPFGYQAVAESPDDLLQCARIHAQEYFPATAKPGKPPARPAHDRIRIGYLSGEFRTQATAILMAGLYEHHDKSRFSITAFDNGEDDGSELRLRLERAFDEFVDISALSDADAAGAIASREIDILVNLNGYFGKGRQGVFSRRPSPIQVNYLGFPGTLGAEYIDYLIADPTVLPEAECRAYVEKIAWLPDCYQANDNRRPLPEMPLTRQEAGLPTAGFVFCCFNNSYKITPARFALWMRILEQVEGSVLWLLEDNATASSNLRKGAAAHGIAPERLVFAPRVPPGKHLARHRLADLFIDSLPYNAHTTAADALWAGLPVLTQSGRTFPGRVASSLLRAIGLPELITTDDMSYETLAVDLALNPEKLQDIRDKLARQRLTTPLFDTERFTRHIEAAYSVMYKRWQAGLPPEHFHVDS